MLYSVPLPSLDRYRLPTPLSALPSYAGAVPWRSLLLHRYPWGLGLAGFWLGVSAGNLVIAAAIGLVVYGQLGCLVGCLASPCRRLGLAVSAAVNSYALLALWQATHSPLFSLVVISQALGVWLVLRAFRPPDRLRSKPLLPLAVVSCPVTPALRIQQTPEGVGGQSASSWVVSPAGAPGRVMATRPVEYVEYEDR